MLLEVLVGCVSGIVSGMGLGGATLLAPMLTIFFGYGQVLVQTVGLISFLPAALAALIVHAKHKRILYKPALKMAALGVGGAIAGALLAHALDNSVLRSIFAVFLVASGLHILFFSKPRGDNIK